MSLTTKLLLRTPITRLNINSLAVCLKVIRLLRQTTMAGFMVLSLVTAAQMVYPMGLARPFTKLDSTYVGLQSSGTIKAGLQSSDTAEHTLTVGKASYRASSASVGIHSNLTASISQATGYSLRERLVPFSMFKSVQVKSIKNINEATLDQTVKKYVSQNTVLPTNPAVALTSSGFVVKPGAQGVSFDQARLKAMLINVSSGADELNYKGQTVKPAVDEQKLHAAVVAINTQSVRQLILNVAGKPYLASPDVLRSWTNITTDEKTGVISISYDAAAIKAWLAANVPGTLKAAIPTKTVVVDDAVVQTLPGQAGMTVDMDKTAGVVSQALAAKADKADAVIAISAIPVEVTRSFSATSHGLELVIANWSKANPGMTAGVTFREIGGQSRQASLNGDLQFLPASVYKLFTTLFLATGITQGQINPATEILPGKTIASCMESMIVVSANDCPLAVASTYGWPAIDAAAKSRGFSATSLTGQLATTTNDVANFLSALDSGSLLSAPDSSALLDRMQRQIYRSAIPAGSPGCTVADKVGFVDTYWHDAAIVTCPHAKYVLVVFTKHGSPQAIRDLAGQISSLL